MTEGGAATGHDKDRLRPMAVVVVLVAVAGRCMRSGLQASASSRQNAVRPGPSVWAHLSVRQPATRATWSRACRGPVVVTGAVSSGGRPQRDCSACGRSSGSRPRVRLESRSSRAIHCGWARFLRWRSPSRLFSLWPFIRQPATSATRARCGHVQATRPAISARVRPATRCPISMRGLFQQLEPRPSGHFRSSG